MTPLLCTDSKLNSTLKRYKKKKISQFLFLVLETRDLSKQIVVLGWRDFAEVRALASLKCGLGSIPSRHHIWVDFIVNFRHVPRVFLGRVLWFSYIPCSIILVQLYHAIILFFFVLLYSLG